LKRRNPLFGCPRIVLIIATTFGIDIDKDVVRRVLAKHLRPEPGGGGPSWLTVIGKAKDSLWSIDLFCCESILLKTHWVPVVMDQFTRRIIGFAVHVGDVDGLSLCRMFNQVISGQPLLEYISADHDPLFRYCRWQANLWVLDIEPVKTVPYVPVSHPFVERLIGAVRRELLDQRVFWNSLDLERKLASFRDYFNDSRVHSALGGRTPAEVSENRERQRANILDHRWQSHCGGLYQLPAAA
jgi:transposase InsO family protein